jgi:hypothetical protein
MSAGYLIGSRFDIANAGADAAPSLALMASSPGATAFDRHPLSAAHVFASRHVVSNKAAPLPPSGTPIVQIQDALAQRAQTGDIAAAMRLFGDLQHCRSRSTASALLDFAAKNKETPSFPEMRAATERVLNWLDVTDSLCNDVTAAQIDGRGEWLRDAALAGDDEAMVCYAMSPNDFGPPFLSAEWFDWTERWRNEAPAFVAQAFADGQADAIALLLDAYERPWSVDGIRMTTYQFGGLVAPDPQLAYAYALLNARIAPAASQRHAQALVDSARDGLSASQIAAAQTFADAEAPRFASAAGDPRSVFPCRDILHAARPW